MSLAVIKTGGKQYLVTPGQKIKIEKIKNKKTGEEIIFKEVLLLENEEGLKIGAPFLEKIEVRAKILKEIKAKKVIIFKYKPKKGYKIKKGHRQIFQEIEISNF